MSWLSIQRCLNQLLTVLQVSTEEDCKSRPLPAFSIAPNTCCCPIKGKLLATVQTEPCHPWRTPQWWQKWNSISSSSTSCTTIFCITHAPHYAFALTIYSILHRLQSEDCHPLHMYIYTSLFTSIPAVCSHLFPSPAVVNIFLEIPVARSSIDV